MFKDANLLKEPMLGVRAATFVSSAAFSLAYGFSYRRYYITLDLDLELDGAPSTADPKAQRRSASRSRDG